MTLPMISIADLHAFTREVEVETDLGPLLVQYRPNALTPLRLAQLERLGREATDSDDDEAAWAFAAAFCEIVSGIPNLVGPLADEEGAELVAAGDVAPIEPEIMVRFSNRVMMGILGELQVIAEADQSAAGKAPRSDTRPSGRTSRRGSFTR